MFVCMGVCVCVCVCVCVHTHLVCLDGLHEEVVKLGLLARIFHAVLEQLAVALRQRHSPRTMHIHTTYVSAEWMHDWMHSYVESGPRVTEVSHTLIEACSD